MASVVDLEYASTVGIIGLIPIGVSLIAQVANNGMPSEFAPWANVAAVGVIVVMFVWLVMYHIPGREKRAEDRQDTRDKNAEVRFDKVKDEFLVALQHREETSRVNAAAGHLAANNLMAGQKELMESFKDLCESFHAVSDSQKDISRSQIEICRILESIRNSSRQ